MANGFMGGFLDTQNMFLQRQAQELNQALQLASMISQEQSRQEARQFQKEEREYQHEQDRLKREWDKDPLNPKNVQANATAEWHKSEVERKKKEDEQQASQKAEETAWKAYDDGVERGIAFGGLKKVDPDRYESIMAQALNAYKRRKKGEYDAQPAPPPQQYQPPQIPTLPGAQPPFVPQPPHGDPQGQPAMPPFMQAGLAAVGLPAGMAPQMPQGAPMAPEAPMGDVMGQAMAGPQLPPMMVPGNQAPFVEPSMDDVLAMQSPAFLMAQQKAQAQAAQAKTRAEAAMITAKAREGLLPLKEEELKIRSILAQQAVRRESREQAMLEQRIGPYAKSLTEVERSLGIDEKLANSLISFRENSTRIADKRATAYAETVGRFGPMARREWAQTEGLAQRMEKEASDLKAAADKAEDDLQKAIMNQEIAQANADSSVDPTAREMALAQAWRLAIQVGHARKQRDTAIADAVRASDGSKSLRKLADEQRTELHGKGVNVYSDNKGPGPTAKGAPKPRQAQSPGVVTGNQFLQQNMMR